MAAPAKARRLPQRTPRFGLAMDNIAVAMSDKCLSIFLASLSAWYGKRRRSDNQVEALEGQRFSAFTDGGV